MLRSIHKNIKEELIKYLSSAESSIFAVVAWFTDEDLFKVLCRKAINGCDVTVIVRDDRGDTNPINFSSKGLDYSKLIFAGGRVFIVPDLHNKYCIIDQEVYISGSYNWTFAASLRETGLENIDIFTDEEKAEEIVENFNFLLKESIPLMNITKSLKVPVLNIEDCEISLAEQLDRNIYRFKLKYGYGYECFVYISRETSEYIESPLNSTIAGIGVGIGGKAYFNANLELSIYDNMLWLVVKASVIEKNNNDRAKSLIRRVLRASWR